MRIVRGFTEAAGQLNKAMRFYIVRIKILIKEQYNLHTYVTPYILMNICITRRPGTTPAAAAKNAGWGTHIETKFCCVLSSNLS